MVGKHFVNQGRVEFGSGYVSGAPSYSTWVLLLRPYGGGWTCVINTQTLKYYIINGSKIGLLGVLGSGLELWGVEVL